MILFDKLSLRQKFFALTALLLVTVGVLTVTQWEVDHAGDAITQAGEQRYASYRLADALRQSSDDLTRMVRTYVVTGDPKWAKEYQEVVAIRAGTQPRPAGYAGIYWDFVGAGIAVPGQPGKAVALLDLMKQAGFTKAELAKLREANEKSSSLITTETAAMNLVKSAAGDDATGKAKTKVAKDAAAKRQADLAEARGLVFNETYHRNKAQIMAPINQFFQMLDTRTLGALDAAQARAAYWRNVQAASSVAMLLLFFAVFYGVFSHIIKSVREAVQVTDAVAHGDLTQNIHARGRDEVAQLLGALARMQTSLTDVVSTVRQASNTVASASAEIAQGNQDLSARTESQASALEETAASMEELASAVRHNADNAAEGNRLAHSAAAVATESGEVVAQVVDTMHGISESSKQVAEIINVIDGIAFQTNILALNAAVEAARAGEHGRGFAVVAGEVRSLAGRAAESAKEIKRLIGDSEAQVEAGTELVGKAGATMQEMVASIGRVRDIMGEISAASEEQSSGVNQVGEAVTQMDQATQQNAAMVEEITAAASSLRDQARELVEAVAVFNLLDGAEDQAEPAQEQPTPAKEPHAKRKLALQPGLA